MDNTILVRLTAEVVGSYVRNSTLTEKGLDGAIEKLPQLIDRVHDALTKILALDEKADFGRSPPPSVSQAPAVPIDKSVTHDQIICLEDGRAFKTLARHLRTQHGLTPEAYREKWKLEANYPMACKAYAKSRSDVAMRIGLGADGRGGKPAYVDPPSALSSPRRRKHLDHRKQ